MLVGSGFSAGNDVQVSVVNVLPLNVPLTLAKTGCVVSSSKKANRGNKTPGIEFFKKALISPDGDSNNFISPNRCHLSLSKRDTAPKCKKK